MHELNIPVVINIGFPGPLRYAKYQRPLDLDDVCITFPELTVVATHIGHPWHLETVALLQKHANFRLMTSGFVPKYVPQEIIYTLNTRAQHKVMFSADYPIQDFQRCVDEALKLRSGPESCAATCARTPSRPSAWSRRSRARRTYDRSTGLLGRQSGDPQRRRDAQPRPLEVRAPGALTKCPRPYPYGSAPGCGGSGFIF